ncbi:hypothetical protein CERSUDRAFT_77189 [Gelatoporia subvermispora B]|uniref:Uncharacterized protein n=1 Tax=Ceriporiopsis subvermispora (strain B) TaxID=914234 RepID=M2PB79_CERS8|nr:hypothetical protein CERSUDRAFT_77189 [Gelatoporia subvermispora B]
MYVPYIVWRRGNRRRTSLNHSTRHFNAKSSRQILYFFETARVTEMSLSKPNFVIHILSVALSDILSLAKVCATWTCLIREYRAAQYITFNQVLSTWLCFSPHTMRDWTGTDSRSEISTGMACSVMHRKNRPNVLLGVLLAVCTVSCIQQANTQGTNAICSDEFSWNHVDVQREWPIALHGAFVDALPGPGEAYDIPSITMSNDCECNSVIWSMFQACTVCQNGTTVPDDGIIFFISWVIWTSNCATGYIQVFTVPFLPNTSVPAWAYMDNKISPSSASELSDQVTVDFVDITAANPNTTTTNMPITTSQGTQTVPTSAAFQGSQPISIPGTSSASGSSTTACNASRNTSASTNKAAIAGGVAGGIGGLVIIGAAALLWRRKISRQGPVLDAAESAPIAIASLNSFALTSDIQLQLTGSTAPPSQDTILKDRAGSLVQSYYPEFCKYL